MSDSISVVFCEVPLLVDYEIDGGGMEMKCISSSGSDVSQIFFEHIHLYCELANVVNKAIAKQSEESGADHARQAREDEES
jgi:hypothetical protein